MTYFIKRELDEPWDNTKGTLLFEGDALDMVVSNRNTGLDSVAEFVIDDNNVIVKSDPRTHEKFKRIYEAQFSVQLNELLLG